MSYRYTIMRTTDHERSVEIVVDTPLAHVETGNTLIVINEHLGGDPVQIERVETTIDAARPPSARIVGTTIYVRGRR